MKFFKQIDSPARVLHWPIFLGSLSSIFLDFGLPIAGKSLGASALEIGGLYSIFTVTTMLLRPAVGWVLDHYSRKRCFVVSLLTYALTMALFALSRDIFGLYIARFWEGIAAACLWISLRTIGADLSTSAERGRTMGRLQEVYMRSGMAGVLIGLLIMRQWPSNVGWTITFAFFGITALLGGIQAWRTVPETKPLGSKAQQSIPKIPISRQLGFLLVIVFTTGLAEALISPIYLIFLQDRFSADVRLLALAFFPAGIVMSLLPSIFGKWSDRFGRTPLMAAGLLGTGLLYGLLPALPSFIWLVALYTLSSIGWSMAEPAKSALISDLSTSDTWGRIYGVYEFVTRIGATVGPLLGGWLYDSVGQTIPFYVTGIIMVVSAIAAFVLLRQPASTDLQTPETQKS